MENTKIEKKDAKSIIKEPIYQQLNRLLRSLINSSEFSVGEQFLTERAISERFQVSRATANKALSSLVSEGLLEFKKGLGTFVSSRHTQSSTVSLKSFTENVKTIGKEPSTKVLQFEKVDVSDIDKNITASLNLSKKEKVYHIRRLRFANTTPMILEERYLIEEFFPNLTKEDVQGSLFNIIENRYQISVTGIDEKLEAISLTKEESKLLNIKPGMASLLIVSIGYTKSDKPLWWERTIHRPDGFELRCQVRNIDNGQSRGIQQIAFKE